MNKDAINDWENYISSGKYRVVLDNDSWYFETIEENEDGETDWIRGGNGPYGRDLLEYMLKRAGVEVGSV